MRTATAVLVAALTFIFGVFLTRPAQSYIEVEHVGFAPPGKHLPAYDLGAKSMLFLEFNDGSCTGVKAGNHTLLTAAHCVADATLDQVNGLPVDARVVVNDGCDHVLVHTDRPLPGRIARIASMPPAGSEIYLWGNPLDLRGILRTGTVAGQNTMDDGTVFNILNINTGPGDSGGAYFDAHGNVVGIVYGNYGGTMPGHPLQFGIGISQPFCFQPHQIENLG
jgi:S1-C subfamily serine protease